MATRRSFIKHSLLGSGILMVTPSWVTEVFSSPDIEISLAEWSLHRALNAGEMDHLEFPAKAKNDFDISVVEYVNTFFGGKNMDFKEAGKNTGYLNELLKRSRDTGVRNHLIMVDEEGPLSGRETKERLKAIDNHKKWVEAAKLLGCKTIRVNLHGNGSSDEKKSASIDSLGRLGEFAGTMDINVVVENHGGESSNGAWVVDVMQTVSRDNVGTLPDFGNFCLSHPWGTTQEGCDDSYDRYLGMKELLPFAKGVSAKTYDFDENGEQPLMDFSRLINIVKDSGFRGYIGIEFEGNNQPEEEGIRKTKQLLERYL